MKFSEVFWLRILSISGAERERREESENNMIVFSLVELTKKLSVPVYKSTTTGYSEFILESGGHDLICKEIKIYLISIYVSPQSNYISAWKAVHQPCRLMTTINFLSSSKLCAKSSPFIDWLKFAVRAITRTVVSLETELDLSCLPMWGQTPRYCLCKAIF